MKKKSTTKRTPKKQPHRYFCMPTTGDEADGNKRVSRIVVFKHGQDAGESYFDSSRAGLNWWRLSEMTTLKCVEIPAALVKRIAKV